MKSFFAILFCLSFAVVDVHAEGTNGNFIGHGSWASQVMGTNIEYQIFAAPGAKDKPVAAAVYLKNLAVERIGQEHDETIIADLVRSGHLVLVLDYAKNPGAKIPFLNREVLNLRSNIFAKKLIGDFPVDLAHVFVLPEGCRLLRDVKFFQDGDRTLGMDIVYPAKPKRAVGTVLEFSCDNKDRMGMYSLMFCTDTTVDTAGAAGFAGVMADHPVAAPYKGFDALPDCAFKLKAAVRTLRALSPQLGLNGKIGVVGFSRGSGMALLLADTKGHAEFEGKGETTAGTSDVQAAVVMSGRFDYLNLLPADKMIPRYEKAWGTRAEHEDVWRQQSAMSYLTTNVAPLFLTINASESEDALHQMEALRHRLEELHVKFQYLPEEKPRGHKMPLDENILEQIHRFLAEHLD